MAILVPQILTNCGRAADLYRSTASTYASSHHASCRVTISSVLVANSGSSNTAGHDSQGVQSSSSASDDLLVCLCPLRCCRPRRESWR